MLNVHWASEKTRKIHCLKIVSSDCLQAAKRISEVRKGLRMFEPQCKQRGRTDTAEELKMAKRKTLGFPCLR